MKKFRLVLILFISIWYYGQDSLKITNCGKQLKSFYLSMDVLHKWQAGQHINWQTGEPDDPDAVSGIRTHCSAFVAAACERRGIYLLRPPEHRQELLANAQISDGIPLQRIFYLKPREWRMKDMWSLFVHRIQTRINPDISLW